VLSCPAPSTQAEEDFDALWKEGKVPGWAPRGEGAAANGPTNSAKAHKPIDLSKFHTVEALESLGLERLKEGLQVRCVAFVLSLCAFILD
jgi:hypothetical protein